MGGCETQEQRVERLIKQLQDADSDVRFDAILALGQIGERAIDAVPALISLLQNDQLGSIGARDAVSVLIQALQDKHEIVYQGATYASTRLGTAEALKAVEEYQSRQ